MEAFEAFVSVALETEGLVVSSGVKFPVALPTRKAAYREVQTHGYEVDLIGARRDRLVLSTVKSAFGSRGVVAEHVTGETTNDGARKRYALLNTMIFGEQSFGKLYGSTVTAQSRWSCACTLVALPLRYRARTRRRSVPGQELSELAASQSGFLA